MKINRANTRLKLWRIADEKTTRPKNGHFSRLALTESTPSIVLWVGHEGKPHSSVLHTISVIRSAANRMSCRKNEPGRSEVHRTFLPNSTQANSSPHRNTTHTIPF